MHRLEARASTRPGVFGGPDLRADPTTPGTRSSTAGSTRCACYASAPLRTADGDVIGTVCAWDEDVRPGDTAESLLRRADGARYAVKRARRAP